MYVLTALPSPSIRLESSDEVVDGEGPGLGSNSEAWCRSVYTECDGKGERRACGGQCEVLRSQCYGDLSYLGTLDLESKTIPEPDGRSSLAFGQDLRIGP